MTPTYTNKEATFLLRLPQHLPRRYMYFKRRHSPKEAKDQKRLNFLDLMELRVWLFTQRADITPWCIVERTSVEQAHALQSPYPLADPRSLEDLALPRGTSALRLDDSLGHVFPDGEMKYQMALERLTRSIEHDGNTPVLWRPGTDMNIALPGANIAVSPSLNSGQPTIEGTGVTCSQFNQTAQDLGSHQAAAERLGLTEKQANVARTFDLFLSEPYSTRYHQDQLWYITLPGPPSTALDRLLSHSL